MADRSGVEERSTGAATATPAPAGATAQAHDNEPTTNVSALAGFQLPWPQGFQVNPTRLLWWGGLAALAAIDLIEWPVALVIGASSFVAERMARQDAENSTAQRT